MAIPLGIMGAVYLNEYGKNRLARFIRFMTDVMTGVPSVSWVSSSTRSGW